MLSKPDLRKVLSADRAVIDVTSRNLAAIAACSEFIKHPLFHHIQHIACYYPFRDEFDVLPLMNALWQAGKKCYLPVVREEHLQFVLFEPASKTTLNRFGIVEPEYTEERLVSDLDLMLVPLLGFDRLGNRLGMGAGFYDRALAGVFGTKPYLLGVGFACQEVPELPADVWDIKLHGILTEKEWFDCHT